MTLIASEASDIQTLQDLRGKRVNIGSPGSGQRGNAIDILIAIGIDPATDIQAESLNHSTFAKFRALHGDRIKDLFKTINRKAAALKKLSLEEIILCGARSVPTSQWFGHSGV